MTEISALGVMSGTSLDGLDLAFCNFNFSNGVWQFLIDDAITIDYDSDWKKKLENAANQSAYNLIALHREYGDYIGFQIDKFLKNKSTKPSIIASHGHTIFHEPHNRLNFQLGDGASIAARTGITTISDFRSLDIVLGGQGAPLVPIGDHFLFGDFDFCINLGGFANISHLNIDNVRVAYDICPVNIVLNLLVSQVGLSYDKNGEMGRNGKIDQALLDELNQINFYKLKAPKSLGKEWVDLVLLPILEKYQIPLADKLRTFYEHISIQIVNCLGNDLSNGKMPKKTLITGGGAFNQFLVELISNQSNTKIVIPSNQIINYKEALIFAFLGVLRYQNQINCLKSVTGSQTDNCGGQIFFMP